MLTNEERIEMVCIMRDMYRDTYGSRPASETTKSWEATSDEALKKEYKFLGETVDAAIAKEQDEQVAAKLVWETRITQFQKDFNLSKGTAIRWDMQALNATHGDELDVGFYLYLANLPSEVATVIKTELTEAGIKFIPSY